MMDDCSWHMLNIDEVNARAGNPWPHGLSSLEAKARLDRAGPNTLAEEKKISFWEEFVEELREPLVLLLLATGALYALWGEFGDAITIFVVILTLNTIEVMNELRAKKAIAALGRMAEPGALVKRDGQFVEIAAAQVVPGDLIALQSGRRVPADARMVEAFGLAVDESALTGESLPVEKKAEQMAPLNAPLAERRHRVYASTLVSRGRGMAVVTTTGMNTEIGRIAGMARQAREPRTPLQNMMSELGKVLVWFALGFSVFIPLVGILFARQPPQEMLLTGLSLAFATIPEELPVIITMVLSLGAFRLSKKHAVVKRLRAVESLGSVTVIATDKTGTLTENRMEVTRFEPESAKQRLLEIGMLCNDALANGAGIVGDPLDAALLRAAQQAGLDAQAARQTTPALHTFSFDNTRKRMSIVAIQNGQAWAAVKGAPEAVLALSTQQIAGQNVIPLSGAERQAMLERAAQMAGDGLRVLALAERPFSGEASSPEAVESELTFVGLVGLQDPPRPEVRGAMDACRRAGIRVIMITGDHPLTARAIAQQTGFDRQAALISGPELDLVSDETLKELVRHTTLYARTTPEHKLRIVQALQAIGERVAVTGDGVNDAPALSAADIGVAMGETGSDVAREAGDMVLVDDNFNTIVKAVEEGRLIYANLKKGVRYYLSCKLALVGINLLPVLLLVPVPFAPVQIILMELFMDLMAAAAFVAEKPEADLLDQKPRDPRARFMDQAMIITMVYPALVLFAAVTGLYLFTWYDTRNLASSQTVAFYAWLVGHVILAFGMRSERQPVQRLGLTSNPVMLAWGAAAAVFLALASAIPEAQTLLKITTLTGLQWAMIAGAAISGILWSVLRGR